MVRIPHNANSIIFEYWYDFSDLDRNSSKKLAFVTLPTLFQAFPMTFIVRGSCMSRKWLHSIALVLLT